MAAIDKINRAISDQARRLDLSADKLTSIPTEIGGATTVTSLFLNDNYKLAALPSEVWGLNLLLLNIKSTSLNAASLAGIGGLPLVVLRASNCPLGGLPADITSCPLLILGIQNTGQSVVPEPVQSLTSLRALLMGRNAISSIPAWLDDLSELEVLGLRGMGLTINDLPPGQQTRASQGFLQVYF